MIRLGMRAAVALCAIVPVAGRAAAENPEEIAAKAKPIACETLTTAELGMAGVSIVSAQSAPADKDLPAACVVTGAANPRTGVDGRHYALDFEMRLPMEWNGRFLHQVNGGNDGEVVPAIGDPKELNVYGGKPALARGFAVLSSDEGHNGKDPANDVYGLQASAVFGLDPEARDDYGYAGDMTLGVIGKAIIAKFYGEAPARSYMFGCSNGGRHAMVAASRMGDEYDGFVAGDPGFNLPRAAIQHAWDVQSFETIDPDVKKSFSAADMALVGRKVLEACARRSFISRTLPARAGRPTNACRRLRSTPSIAPSAAQGTAREKSSIRIGRSTPE
jgi:Tannase and feruloyl esterase